MTHPLLFTLAILLSIGSSASRAWGQTAAPNTNGVDQCPRARTQFALTACADTIARQADAALTREYERVLASLSSPRQRLLRVAQHQWMAYRAAECRYVASEHQGGSMYPMQQLFCYADLTNARREELREQAADEEK